MERDRSSFVFPNGELVENRFRIRKFLGAGGMGEVYEAEDVVLGAPVALKTVRVDKGEQARAAERLKREILMARRVTHANVCRIYDLFQTSTGEGRETLFLTMELLHGETLSQRLAAKGPLTAEEALPLVRQMAMGLDAAHQAGVIHRDFKTGNVMVDGPEGAPPRVVVTDFGLSLSAGAAEAMNTESVNMGTPPYMAPEQLERGEASPASDIYALGVVMFQMLTAKLPHEGATPMAMALAKVNQEAPLASELVSNVPAEWDAVIARCLAREPGERFQRAGDVARALTHELEVTAPPRAVQRAAAGRWRRAAWALAVVAVVAIFALAGVRWWQSPYRPTADARSYYDKGVEALRNDAPHAASLAFQRAVAADGNWHLSHARLAQCYWEMAMVDRAREEMVRVGALVQGRWLPEAESLLVGGLQHLVVRDRDEALRLLAQLASRSRDKDRVTALFDLGRAQLASNQFPAAKQTFATLREMAATLPGVWLQSGIALRKLGDNSEALSSLQKAEEMYRQQGSVEGVAASTLQIGRMRLATKEMEESRRAAEKILEVAKNADAAEKQAGALSLLARIATYEGDTTLARRLADRLVALADEQGMPEQSADGFVELGSASMAEADYGTAVQYLRDAMAIARRAGIKSREASVALALAQALIRQGKTDEGATLLQSARRYYQSEGDWDGLHRLSITDLDWRIEAGENREGPELAARFLSEMRQAKNEAYVMNAMSRVGHYMLVRGDYPAAIRNAEELVKWHQPNRPLNAAKTIGNAVDYYVSLGDAKGAERQLERLERAIGAVSGDRSLLHARRMIYAAELERLRGNPEKALALVRAAAVKFPKIDLGDTPRLEAEMAVEAGQFAEAAQAVERSVKKSGGSGNPQTRAEAFGTAAYVALRSRQYEKALELAERTLEIAREHGHAETAAVAALVQWAAMKKLDLRAAKTAKDDFETLFRKTTATWTEEQVQMYRHRPDIQAIWPKP